MFSNSSLKIFSEWTIISFNKCAKCFPAENPLEQNATSGADQVCEFMCAKITTTSVGAAVVDTLRGSRLWKGKEHPGAAAAIFREKSRSHDLSPRSRPRGRKMCFTRSCAAYRFSDCFSIVICAIYCNNCVNVCVWEVEILHGAYYKTGAIISTSFCAEICAFVCFFPVQ